MYNPRAMYSFKMSFCTVPRKDSLATPCLSAVATYNANRVVAGAFIVIDVETLPKSISENNTSISSSVSIGTPTLPTSPNESSSSESNPNCVGKSNATDSPV